MSFKGILMKLHIGYQYSYNPVVPPQNYRIYNKNDNSYFLLDDSETTEEDNHIKHKEIINININTDTDTNINTDTNIVDTNTDTNTNTNTNKYKYKYRYKY
jgi:hypothetical protein